MNHNIFYSPTLFILQMAVRERESGRGSETNHRCEWCLVDLSSLKVDSWNNNALRF